MDYASQTILVLRLKWRAHPHPFSIYIYKGERIAGFNFVFWTSKKCAIKEA